VATSAHVSQECDLTLQRVFSVQFSVFSVQCSDSRLILNTEHGKRKNTNMLEPLFYLEDATIVRLGGVTTFRHLNWTVHDGETWAIVGPVASGKTTLAEAIRGRHRFETGAIGWPFVERLRAEGHPVAWPIDVIHLLSFKEDSWLFSYGRHF